MSIQVAETIFEKVKSLPLESQEEALSFVEKLAQRKTQKRLRIFEKIDEIVAEKPGEIWDELPTDSSVNVDHYLYGTDKK